MELRDIEKLANRIDVAFGVNEGKGVKLDLSREETLLIRRMLDKEISIRRLTEGPKTPEKLGKTLDEFMAEGGKE